MEVQEDDMEVQEEAVLVKSSRGGRRDATLKYKRRQIQRREEDVIRIAFLTL